MITQVSAANVSGVAKDPRRTARHIRFKNKPGIPYRGSSTEAEYEKHKKNAFKTNAAIVLGAIAFMFGYFLLSGLERAKK